MSKIKLLPENLANQIAAGEVVERPASVVKELLENAIDAGARHIAIQVEGDGARLIRVIDDGQGMDQDDVLLCLERHATSKLLSEEQLGAIQTLGFRGEALPSIASVSRLTILSRPRQAALGTMVHVRFGKVLKVHDMGASHGTSMEVKNLFGNVPVRKKFLKSSRTELFHIEDAVRNYGAAYPALGITYTVNGKDVLVWPAATDSMESRLKRLFSREAGAALMPVDKWDQEESLQVAGSLVAPDLASTTGARLRLFVNGRVVRDRMLAHAVAEGLHGFLMKGRQPAGVLFVSLAPAAIDINVHPTKQEIRFHKPRVVHRFLAAAVRQAITAYQQDRKKELFRTRPLSEPEKGISRSHGPCRSESAVMPGAVREPQSLFSIQVPAGEEKTTDIHPSPAAFPRADGADFPGQGGARSRPEPARQDERLAEGRERPVKAWFAPGSEAVESAPGIRLVGQLANSYILCESGQGLLVIDQHAAHERLLFESLKAQYATQGISRQLLLFPKVFDCTSAEIQLLEQHADELGLLGVEVENFGGASYVVKAVPAIMASVPPEEVMAGIFARFAETAGARGGVRIDAILSTMACKAAVKAGQRLDPAEMARLLAAMQEADVFSHCPHGRPAAKRFSPDAIKKWFHRT